MQHNLLTDWATLLLESFADSGITDVVISPGSRSTPFVVAAARSRRLRCHDSIDERAAAFFALGQARVTGRPSLLICTSGTAAAHYLPAVIEAELSYLPLLILTADRPFELQRAGASQTIDQIKLFGDHARAFFELGSPDASSGALRGVRRIAAQAVAESRWPIPGAVHVNARARKPLEPADAIEADELDLRAEVAALLTAPIASMPRPLSIPDPKAIASAADMIRSAKHGLIIAGPAPILSQSERAALLQLVAATGFPVLAEAASQLRFTGVRAGDVPFCDGFDAVLRSGAFRMNRPDLTVQLGAFPISAGFERYVSENLGCPNLVITPHGWHDPFSRNTLHLASDLEATAARLVERLGAPKPDTAWNQLFESASFAATVAAGDTADPEGGALTEGGVARALIRAAPASSRVVLGNSLAIRLVDSFVESNGEDLEILSQRGAAGIDGLISGAAGASRAGDRPLGLLIGDVSFFHDTNGLALARGCEERPLVIAVIQNRGGRIFEQLPIAHSGVESHVLAHITTPHALEVEPVCRGFGVAYARAEDRGALEAALAQAFRTAGCTVVEAVVPPQEAVLLFERVWSRTDAAIRERSA